MQNKITKLGKTNTLITNISEDKTHNNLQTTKLQNEAKKINKSYSNTQKEKINLTYQNCRGFGSKEKIIHAASLACDHEIIILTETWLTKKHKSNAYFPDKFIIYRRDRTETRSDTNEIKKGGGLIMAIENRIFPPFS